MKNILSTLTSILLLLMITSCGKNYSCACHNMLDNTSDLIQVSAKDENEARNICTTNWYNQNSSTVGSCELVKNIQ